MCTYLIFFEHLILYKKIDLFIWNYYFYRMEIEFLNAIFYIFFTFYIHIP